MSVPWTSHLMALLAHELPGESLTYMHDFLLLEDTHKPMHYWRFISSSIQLIGHLFSSY